MKKYSGVPVSAGIGMGKAFVYKENAYKDPGKSDNGENEQSRYRAAAETFGKECILNAGKIKESAGEDAAKILFSHASVVSDPYSVSNAEKLIGGGMSPEEAAKKVWGDWKAALLDSPDPLTKERAADADDILKGILTALSGQSEEDIPDGCVLVCREFTPSLAAKSEKNAAVVAEKGSSTSHGAILAAGMGIPCVMGVDIGGIEDGDEIICDGNTGEVVISPGDGERKKYEELKNEYEKSREDVKKYAFMTAESGNGHKISVMCNAGNPADIERCISSGGDGVGLFRTEFLFSEREYPPDEDEQYSVYRDAASALCGRELVIRTLDTGGDKKIPYYSYPREDNPFLGLRGIRYCIKKPEILRIQIRAILRAALFGDVRIMLPMVTAEDEIIKVRNLVAGCRRELRREGVKVPENVPVGIMIETPAAALTAKELSRHCDFFSIGTNDLTQYIMAADRGNAEVRELYDTMSPAVLRAVEMTFTAAKEAGIPCHVCGEAAADEELLSFLTELGVDAVSVSPARIAQTKKVLFLKP